MDNFKELKELSETGPMSKAEVMLSDFIQKIK